jgi:hypothetical protein
MWIIVIAIALILVGCGSKLKIYNVDPKQPDQYQGIRVHEAVSYVVTKKIKTEKCPERTEESIVHLPVGAPYDINVEPGWFAKSEFSVQFSDSGALKQVTLNSTPQVAETINAVANLAEKVGKIAAPAAPVGARDCGAVTAETIESVRRLQLQ